MAMRGRPAFQPTDEQRKNVEVMVGLGIPDEQTDFVLRDTETDHHFDIFSLFIRRLKCRPSSHSHNLLPSNIHFPGDSRHPKNRLFNLSREPWASDLALHLAT